MAHIGQATAIRRSSVWRRPSRTRENAQLVAYHRQALFLVLVRFLGSLGFSRPSARLGRSPRMAWWPGSVVSDGAVHLHHLVWGICPRLAGGNAGRRHD